MGNAYQPLPPSKYAPAIRSTMQLCAPTQDPMKKHARKLIWCEQYKTYTAELKQTAVR